jgi:hypothetical protein
MAGTGVGDAAGVGFASCWFGRVVPDCAKPFAAPVSHNTTTPNHNPHAETKNLLINFFTRNAALPGLSRKFHGHKIHSRKFHGFKTAFSNSLPSPEM